MHKCSIRICFGVGISFAEYAHVPVIFGKFLTVRFQLLDLPLPLFLSFSSLSDAAGAFSREAFNSDIISASMEGVTR